MTSEGERTSCECGSEEVTSEGEAPSARSASGGQGQSPAPRLAGSSTGEGARLDWVDIADWMDGDPDDEDQAHVISAVRSVLASSIT